MTPMTELCRYNAYIESSAWSTNLKQKLASGSPVLAIVPRYPEWFSRALVLGTHYVKAESQTKSPLKLCDEVVKLVRAIPCCDEVVGWRGLSITLRTSFADLSTTHSLGTVEPSL